MSTKKDTSLSVTIEVKKEHFDAAFYAATKSQSYPEETCLLAQAIKEIFPHKKVAVNNADVAVGKGKSQIIFGLPVKAQKLIKRFDNIPFWRRLENKEKLLADKLRKSLPVSFKMIPTD